MLKDLSRRDFLISSAAGAASFGLGGLPSASAASLLPTLSEVFAGSPGTMTIANYARYVMDRSRVNASRAEHQVYADSIREHDRLVMGGPLLGDDGRPRGLLLVYQVTSKQQAEALAQNDPFVQQGAIATYSLDEWNVRERNMDLLAAALVPEEQRAPGAPDAHAARLYVNYVKYVSDTARIERVKAAHQSYAQAIKANGRLVMAGPFADGSGAMFIYRAQSRDEAMALLQKDPHRAEGVYESTTVSEWRLFGLNAGLIP